MTSKHQFDGHRVRISDVFDLQMGKTPSRKNPLYWRDGNHDWVSIADLGSFGKYVGKTKERINDFAVKESGIKLTPANTVLMSFKLSLGKTSITTEPVYTNEAIMAFINKGLYPVDTSFMYHQCRSKDWAAGTNAAVMGKTLNKRTLGQSVIFLPSLEEQEDIAAKLDFIDEQLQKAKDVLHELDSLVKSRFVEMFGTPDNNVFSLPVKTVGEISEQLIAGGDKPKEILKNKDEEHPYPVFANGVIEKGLQGFSKEAKVNKPAVTIAARGTIGFCCVREAGFTPIVRLISLVPNSLINVVYLKHFIDLLNFAGSGSSQAQLTLPVFREKRIFVPRLKDQMEFASFVAQVDKSRFVAQQQIEKLQMLYDSLAQEYFGE